jgi:hypothetical protein
VHKSLTFYLSSGATMSTTVPTGQAEYVFEHWKKNLHGFTDMAVLHVDGNPVLDISFRSIVAITSKED